MNKEQLQELAMRARDAAQLKVKIVGGWGFASGCAPDNDSFSGMLVWNDGDVFAKFSESNWEEHIELDFDDLSMEKEALERKYQAMRELKDAQKALETAQREKEELENACREFERLKVFLTQAGVLP